jgi:hypothetical protein
MFEAFPILLLACIWLNQIAILYLMILLLLSHDILTLFLMAALKSQRSLQLLQPHSYLPYKSPRLLIVTTFPIFFMIFFSVLTTAISVLYFDTGKKGGGGLNPREG